MGLTEQEKHEQHALFIASLRDKVEMHVHRQRRKDDQSVLPLDEGTARIGSLDLLPQGDSFF